MHAPGLVSAHRRSWLTPAAGLVATALVAALSLTALPVPSSQASSRQSEILKLTIKASNPTLPKTISAGIVSFTLINDSKAEIGAGVGRAKAGVTATQIRAIVAASGSSIVGFERLEQSVTFLGGPDNVLPGASESAALDLTTPGLYGLDLSGDSESGRLMLFEVSPKSAAPEVLPAAGVTIRLKDFKFIGLPKQLAAGTVTLRLENTGDQVHEMGLFRLDAGKSEKDALKFAESPQGQNGPQPAWMHDAGGLNTISPHYQADVVVNLTPGYYLVMCGMPDPKKQGEPHFMEGMAGNFTVHA